MNDQDATRAAGSSAPACSTCRFYYRKTEQEHHAWIDEYGCKQEQTHETETRLCRRFPQHVGHHPGDWCGEYRPSNTKLTGGLPAKED
jgi:hypothetical protein